MTIKVTEKMRQAASRYMAEGLRELGEIEHVPGQQRPDWEQVSIELEAMLSPEEATENA